MSKKSKKTPAKVDGIVNSLTDIVSPFQQFQQISQTDTLRYSTRGYLISNDRMLLSQMYVENGLVQVLVDIPVDDGMRGGIEIKSKQLDPEQIYKLQIEVEQQDILNSVIGQAVKWNRLFGGSAILIVTDQDPMTPFDVKSIGKDSKLSFVAIDMWELFFGVSNPDDQKVNSMIQADKFEYYNYYGQKIHKSRVMRMKGMIAPSIIRQQLRGWGFSVVEGIVRSINQYLKANSLSFEILDEYKIDIFKIQGLASALQSANGSAAIQRRVQLANQQKNFQNALTMDTNDDWQQKNLNFAGIAEIMREIRIQIASDLRIPMTKLFGMSSTGFNSGEDDIENYNAMVESQVRLKCKYDILKVIGLMCQKQFGMIPDDLSVEFKPLRILSSEQEENVKTQKFGRLIQAKQAGEINSKEFKDACNKDNLLSIQLESIDAYDMYDKAGEDKTTIEEEKAT